MKFGTYPFNHENLSLREKLDSIKRVGFDFVALSYEELEEGAAYCRKIGLPIENVHLNARRSSLLWVEDARGDEIVDRYCEQIEKSAALGIQVGIAHVTYGSELPPPNPAGLRRFERMVACAERCGFTLCLENTRASDHLDYAMKRLQSPNVRYCYDSGHDIGMATGTEFFGTYLKNYGDRLGALHIHDSIPGFDLHVAPFDGAIDWLKIAAELAQTAYGREKLCLEPGGRICAKKEGKTAAELSATYAAMAIAEDKSLVRFYDGCYTVYEQLDFEQILRRYYDGLVRIAEMIEHEKA